MNENENNRTTRKNKKNKSKNNKGNHKSTREPYLSQMLAFDDFMGSYFALPGTEIDPEDLTIWRTNFGAKKSNLITRPPSVFDRNFKNDSYKLECLDQKRFFGENDVEEEDEGDMNDDDDEDENEDEDEEEVEDENEEKENNYKTKKKNLKNFHDYQKNSLSLNSEMDTSTKSSVMRRRPDSELGEILKNKLKHFILNPNDKKFRNCFN